MKKNREIFLSKSLSFAMEMVRAALRRIPNNVHMTVNLDGLWKQMNLGSGVVGNKHRGERHILIALLIYPSNNVSAECDLECTDGEWKSGSVEIRLEDPLYRQIGINQPRWKFRCELNAEGRLNVEPIK